MENIKIPVGTKLYFRSKNGEILNVTTVKTYEGSLDKNRLDDKIFEGGYLLNVKPSILVQEDGKTDYRKKVFMLKVEDYVNIVGGGEDIEGLNLTKTNSDLNVTKSTIVLLDNVNLLGVNMNRGDKVILSDTLLETLKLSDYVLIGRKNKTFDLTKVEFTKFGVFKPLINKDIVEIRYKGEKDTRKVVITNIYYDKRMIEVFQLEGYSSSGNSKGIKHLYIDEVELVK